MDSAAFVIDLNSPQNLAARHREAVVILEAKQQELASLRDLERQVTKWQAVVDFLASQLPDIELVAPEQSATRNHAPNNGSKPDMRGASIGDLAVEVVNREIRKIRAKKVRAILNAEGHDFSAEQVSNALHYAAHSSERIQAAPGRGMYAPLAYQESELPDSTASDDATGQAQAHRPEGEAASTLERLPGLSNGSPTAVQQVPPPNAAAGRGGEVG